ncbi:MAG: hypothetical protein M3R17_07635 [Bacteroidota bacterium]|nr:hypothetical protein [Bacteroidota bacterium]
MPLKLIADRIIEIISDYQNEEGVQLTSQNVSEWINQFEEEDRRFILEEFLHLLQKGIYVSRAKAKELLSFRSFGFIFTHVGTCKYTMAVDENIW